MPGSVGQFGRRWAGWFLGLALACVAQAADPQWLTYKGLDGPGKGKRIVFVTGDEEYRSEESMPAMARILAERHGFQCSVLFSINPANGEIDPKVDNNIPGLELLKDADLMVVFMRFRHLPPEQMAHFGPSLAFAPPPTRLITTGFNRRSFRSGPGAGGIRNFRAALGVRCWARRGLITTAATAARARWGSWFPR